MGDVIIDGLTGANRLVILDANGKIPALDGSAVTAIAGANFSTGTIPVARLDTGTTAGKVVKLDGNAKLPAVSGVAITGVVGATKNASDPVITTNPSGGVGTEWQNTTSGEVFVCTDATAGENVWTNVGGRSGDVAPYFFGGTQYGFCYGGTYPTSGDVQKWSFTSDGNATDVGDQSVQRQSYTAASSATHGYCMGGAVGTKDVIDKFPFATGGTMTDVGNLTVARHYPSGMSTVSYGFTAGGAPTTNVIDRFAFSTDGNATDWADLHTARSAASNGCSSSTHGYIAGGASNQIQKFVFATQTNGTDVGDLLASYSQAGATSSATHGYSVGGNADPSGASNVIQKFSFTTDGNSTDVGDVTGVSSYGVFLPGTASSRTYGYRAGGDDRGGGTAVNVIDKHSFTTDGNATDVGDLAHTQNYMGQGSQY
jgi:hypothetical protein